MSNFFKELFVKLGLMVMFSVLCQGAAFATCAEEDLQNKLEDVTFRQFLIGADEQKAQIFEQATALLLEPILQVDWRQQENINSSDKEQQLNSACATADKVNRIADDILAGGTGTGKKLLSPWKQYTPEEMVALMQELTTLCDNDPKERCAKEDFFKFSDAVDLLEQEFSEGKISAPAYVDGMSEQVKKAILFVKK